MIHLLDHGFSFQQSFSFLKIIDKKHASLIKEMEKALLRGSSLPKTFAKIGLSSSELAQLQFAEIHGDFVGTLLRVTTHMKDVNKNQHKLRQLLAYPFALLLFILVLLVVMKKVVYPQLQELYPTKSISRGVTLLQHFPDFLGIGFFIFLAGGLLFYIFSKQKSALQRANLWSHLPIFKLFMRSYYTALFATEWGNLLVQGLELRDIILIMGTTGYTPLMQEMADQIEDKLEHGIALSVALTEWSFLTEELCLIIRKGEIKGALGQELMIYGQEEWRRLMERIERSLAWLQPLIFMLIAGLIISIYAALLLPIYSGMGDFV